MKKFYETYFALHERLHRSRPLASVISLGWLVAFVFAIKTSVLDANNIPSPSMEPTLMIGDFLFVNKMRYTFDLPYTNIHLIRLAYPKRGDIVTFTPPQDSSTYSNKTLVKRVVGVPGDILEVNDHEITIYEEAKDHTLIRKTRYPVKRTDNADLLKTLQNGRTAETEELFTETIVDPKTQETVVEHYMMKRKGSSGNANVMSTPRRKWRIPSDPPFMYLMMGDNRDHSSDGRACDMVDSERQKDPITGKETMTKRRRMACNEFNTCMDNTLTGHQTEQQCILIYEQAEGATWGLIDADKIHGKVYLSYLSVNWGSGRDEGLNPIVNLFKTITGDFTGVYVRWERTFRRIY